MFAIQPRTEIAIRVFLTTVMLFNALVPTVALAAPVSETSPVAEKNSPRSLPEQKPAFYDAPEIKYPQQTSPEPDKTKPPVPPRAQVEFTLTTEPAVVPVNGVVTFHVQIRNHSKGVLTSLVFRDSLEAGLEYKPDQTSSVTYDAKKKEVTLALPDLDVEKEYVFSYAVTVTSAKRNAVRGKVWLHNVELNSAKSNLHLKTGAVIAVELANTSAKSELVPLNPEGGWNDLGRVNVHMAKDSVGKNALVMSSPAKVSGKGPALQFQLDVYETSDLSVDVSTKEFNEQAVSVKKPREAKFKTPAFLEINLDGFVDLKHVPAGQEPYVATYDEEHKIWVKVPILETDPTDNSVTVEAAHFSTWGAGLGSSLPQNGANVLLFDQPYTSLFTGSARYSIPVWTPAGRGGMQPDISLSYSSGTVDGVLGDVQAPWVGVGWNIDDVEIVRKITTDENGYGYKNEFALTLNGSLYQLVQDEFHPNRYFTDQAAFLYIERHNYPFGGPSTDNTTGEWWEVVTTDGTRYRLGWSEDSEQLALMYGYACTTEGLDCITPDGAYASLGYAGKAENLVALRWRVDRVSDTHGNYMEYNYSETQPDLSTTLAPFDRESYLQTISYTGFKDPDGVASDLDTAYQIYFKSAPRSEIGDVPTEYNIWDNIDAKYLSEIWSCYGDCAADGSNAIRKYRFGYSLANVPNTNGTLTLTSLDITGGGYTENGQTIPVTHAPTVRFTYQNKNNRASGNGDVFKYPRLATIDNGSGGLLTFNYENDGRANNSWYNYRVQNVTVDSGMGLAKKQSYVYATPVYSGSGGDTNLGSLTGYTTVTESLLDFANSDTALVKTKHTFGTTGLDIGREMQTEVLNGSDTVLRKTTNVYVTDNTGAPKDHNGNPFPGWNYRYLRESASYVRSGSTLTLITKNTYYNDPYTGNLLVQNTYLGNSLYRKTYYEYATNPDIQYYILDKVSRVLLVDAGNQIYADTRYHYDCDNADECSQEVLTRGDVTLTQTLTGNSNQTNQTIDTVTTYNVYGNAISVKAYRAYGTVNTYPASDYWASSTTYDSVENDPTQNYPVSVTNALGQSSSSAYLRTLGVAYQTTDPNGWTTSMTYDGLGRTRSVTPPGLSQPGTWYIYPSPDANGRISSPHSVEMQILDTVAGRYRSVWGIYDGAGRILQTQVDAGNKLLVNTTLFNAQGLASQQSLPYEVTGAGGNYVYDPGDQFTTSQYDALGRVTSVTAPGDITTQTSYDGLTTTTLDPNGNKVSRTTDGLGRMISVAEFSDPETVYATTTYFYDSADRLIRVKDAKLTTTTIQYDWLGRKLGMDDPDMGVWSYNYDSLGNMTSQTDARQENNVGCQLSFEYDALNRLQTKNSIGTNIKCGQAVHAYYFYDGDNPATVEYDPRLSGQYGLRTDVIDASGSSSWSYADYGRTVTETRVIGTEQSNEQHSVTTHSDWLGRALTTTYDDGEVVSYTYDDLGRPDQMKSSASGATLVDLAYNVLGQIESQTLGNGTQVTNTYDAQTTRLTERKAETGSTTLLDLAYDYDANGNITRLEDRQLNETQFYTYDFLNRLTSAVGASGTPTTAPTDPETYGQQFEYDKVGNIEQLNNWGTAPTLPTQQQQGRAPSDDDFVLAYSAPEDKSLPVPVHAPVYQEEPTATPSPTYTATVTPTATPRIDDNYTVVLLHMNGTDESTVFTDESGKEWTAAGNAQIDIAESKFGGASGLFDGSGDSISTPDHDNFHLSDHDWTFDFWVRFNTLSSDTNLITQYEDADNWMKVWVDTDPSRLYFAQTSGGEVTAQFYANAAFALNTWYHIVVERKGNSPKIAVNGTFRAVTEDVTIANKAFGNLNGALTLGMYEGLDLLDGQIDEFRFSNGIARWITNFTPPVSAYSYQIPVPTNIPPGTSTPSPTSTYTFTPTPIANNAKVVSLLHMDGGDGSETFTDETGRAWTAHGNAQIDTAESKFGGASAYFDGSGDYLAASDSNDFYFNGDFTVDFWARFNSVSGNRYFFSQKDTDPPGHWVYFFYDGTSTIKLQAYNGSEAGVSGAWGWTPSTGTWYHIALVKSGNTYKVFVDGNQIGSPVTDTDPWPNVASPMYVGILDASGYCFKGWLDDMRFTKGVARWTSNFTPPDSPHPYATLTPTVTATYTPTATPVVVTGVDGSYTVSLLHMNGADGSTIFPDETGNIWTAAGDAQIDTEQSVFGGGSALLDGNGDSVSSPDSNEFYLNGNFTIDLRARFNALPTTGHTEIFFAQWVDSDNCQYVGVQNNSGTYQLVIRARSGGTDSVLVLKDTTLSLNTWYHLAFVRQGNNYMIFKNGNQVGTTVTDADAIPNYAAPAQIGARGSGSEFNGWIDEFRVSKDIARWTSNFTPPDSEYIHETDPSAVLMAYWDFEVVTDTTVRDVAPSDLASNNATLQNGATIVADGADRNAVSFDGTDDSVTVADHAEIRKNGSSFTLSAWINPSALVTNHTQYIINKGVSATNFDYGFITTSRSDVATATATPAVPNVDTDGKLVFRVGDLTPNKVIGPILPVNTWTLVTGVYDSIKDELRLYINGRLVAVEKVTGTVSMGTGALSFSPAGNLYQGKLDEVRFYSRALTDDEVTQLLGTFITPTPIPPSPTTAVTPATPTLVPTPLPESAKKWGTGADGNLTIAATATAFNLNAHTSNGRTCADGVAYSVTRLGSTIATLNATPAAGCLNPGDEIMLINLKSAGRNDHNAGAYEFLRVASVNGNSVLFTSMKTRWYGNAWHSDANIGTGSGQQRVMLMRVPNYNNVTLEGTLTSSGYDGYKYGVVVFHVAGTFTGAGTVSANARGYPGAVLGESLADGYSAGHNALYNLASGTGVGSNGGGGGHATVGKIGGSDESAGSGGSLTYGSPQISQLFMGSGGGAANLHWYHNSSGNWAANPGPNGGDGGGIVLIAGQTINFTGAVQAIGATKPSNDTPLRGGAGAGGSIRIEGNTVTLGSLNARGGSSADAYGFGGKGRIGVYYENSVSISTSNPSAYTGVFGQGPAPTPSPTPISFATPNPYGTGADGDLTVETGSTFNLNTDISETRSCADGVAYNVTGLTVTSAKLTTSPITGCLSIGDEVMLVHLRGSGPNIGNFEFLRVGGITGNTVYFKTQKVNFYGASADSDASIGLGTDQQRVMLLRVPNYETVTVNGTLTGNAYDYNNYLYGVVAFRVHGALTGAGTIHASKKGFPGEIWGSVLDKGYSPGGNATYNDYARDNANGGGGGHATAGKDGGTKDTDGAGGKVNYGNPQLSLLFMGSGGGRANLAWPAGDPGPNGGNGGGIVFVAGETINFTGSINAIGATKPSNDTSLRGGAGAGGSIRLEGNTITLGSLSAGGGSPSDTYGAGGAGRIAIYYSGSLSNEATLCAGASTYCKNTSETSTPTSTPTPVTGTNPGTSGLVSWWALDETSGTRNDSHGTNHLTDTNTVGYATGMKGNAASFVPANQERLTIPDNADISTGNIDFTLIAHVYLNSTANGYNLVDKSNGTTFDYRLAYNPSTGFRLRVADQVYVDSGPVSANTWYTVIAWHDAANDTINIQVNNGTVNTVSYAGGATDTSAPLSLGSYQDGTTTLDGRLDEVALYKRVLTAAERTWLYDGGSTRTYAEVSIAAAQDWYASNYTYSTAIPHAVTEVDRGFFADSFTYDENGNMTCRVESGVTYKQEYNAENRISSIWKLASGTCAEPGPLTDKWDFTYDGDGARTGQLHTLYTNGQVSSSETTRYYFGGAYETTNGVWKKYYSFGGTTLMRDATGFKYFLSDHLGSVSVVLSPDGDDPDTEIDVEQQRYLPFGEVRTDIATPPYRITSTDFTYTGQRNVTGTGLMDYNARFYSPTLGRFIQPDSVIPNGNPQSLNRYAYVVNNPLRYTDPTGHKWDECKEGQSDYLCKRHMLRVNKIKARWKAEEAARKAAAEAAARAAIAQQSALQQSYCSTNPGACGGTAYWHGTASVSSGVTSFAGGTVGGGPGGINAGALPISNRNAGSEDNIILPPNDSSSGPLWCEVIDCVLSAVSFFASAFTFFPPPIDAIAFGVDVVATVWAGLRTWSDYNEGKISSTRFWALEITGVVGLVPLEVGAGSSFLNLLMTATGLPR